MNSWGLDLLSKLAELTSLDALREDFPRNSDEGLCPAEVRGLCTIVLHRATTPHLNDKSRTAHDISLMA